MAAVASVNTALLGARRNIANARSASSSAKPVLARSARNLTVRAADGASRARPCVSERAGARSIEDACPGSHTRSTRAP